jgi:alpha-beta hydrolase superfamily lysophospholipase
MNPNWLDNPLVNNTLFYPRAAAPGTDLPDGVHDGTIPAAEDIALGYRLYVHTPGAPLIIFFHGNGEIASDYDSIAPLFHRAGASLIVVDYRGYGWSSGQPKVSALLPDTEAVIAALPDVLAQASAAVGAWFVMGRSLGSACALHAAHTTPAHLTGVIIESGFAHAIPLLARLGLPVERLQNIPDPIGNVRKIAQITLPLLVIHGERDTLIPVHNGQALYDASPAALKRLARIPSAGHNDLLFYGVEAYFDAVAAFLTAAQQPETDGDAAQ